MVLDFAKHRELQKSFQSFSGEFAEICRITDRHTHTQTHTQTDRKLGCYTYKNQPRFPRARYLFEVLRQENPVGVRDCTKPGVLCYRHNTRGFNKICRITDRHTHTHTQTQKAGLLYMQYIPKQPRFTTCPISFWSLTTGKPRGCSLLYETRGVVLQTQHTGF
jgi:hypothetical protein